MNNLTNLGTILPKPLKQRLKFVFGLLPSSIRYGKTFKETYDFLGKSQWWSRERLEEYQLQELNKLLNHAYHNVPYYKRVFDERGLKPKDIQDFNDLKELPYLTKDDFKLHSQELVARNVKLSGLSRQNTSGTGGKPLQFYTDKDSDQKEWAFIFHQWSRVGYDREDFRVEIRGKIIKNGKPMEFNPVFRVLSLSPQINLKRARYYLRELERFKPKFIHGYPSVIGHFAHIIKEHDLKIPFQLKAVLFASEAVYSWERDIVEEVFGCRAFSHYGLAERAVLGAECENSYNYHCQPQYGITETDPETNEIIGTGFLNRVTPFIRYRTTDIAGEEVSCDCDREYHPIFKDIEGRIEDYLVTEEGLIGPAIITHPFKNLENIKNTQIIQESMDLIVLRVVPWKRDSAYEHELEELKADLQKILGPITIEIQETHHIERLKSGKFKWIISQVSPNILEKGF